MISEKTIAKRIKLARVERDLKQSDLANLLGTTQQYVARLESGKINPGALNLYELAKVLQKPVEWFYEPFDGAESLPKAQSAAASARRKKVA